MFQFRKEFERYSVSALPWLERITHAPEMNWHSSSKELMDYAGRVISVGLQEYVS
jgi:hypothetical protein